MPSSVSLVLIAAGAVVAILCPLAGAILACLGILWEAAMLYFAGLR